jgi:glycosyltransferase involved in cell wall biosynthesis
MQLLFSVIDDYPPRRPDVVQLFFRDLAARGVHCVWYFRNRPCISLTEETHLGQPVRIARAFPIKGIPGQLVNRISYWLGDIPFMVSGARKTDIIQVRDKYLAAGLALLVARLTNKKATYWCSYPYPEHSSELARIERNPLKAISRRIFGRVSSLWLHRFIMPRMDHIFVQSDQMLADLCSYGVPKAKMTAVPMGVPKSLLNENHPARGVATVPNRLVYLGSLGRARRLETLIDAFALVTKRVPGASLVMVGDGDVPSERVALESYVRSLNMESHVEFTGLLSPDAAWERVGEASICVSPIYPSVTLRQGSPTKLFEYMALGKVTVANDHPEQSKILAESAAGICVPWDASAFADAICELLQDPVRATAMAARGPAWIAANRTYDHLADLVYVKYQEIIASH